VCVCVCDGVCVCQIVHKTLAYRLHIIEIAVYSGENSYILFLFLLNLIQINIFCRGSFNQLLVYGNFTMKEKCLTLQNTPKCNHNTLYLNYNYDCSSKTHWKSFNLIWTKIWQLAIQVVKIAKNIFSIIEALLRNDCGMWKMKTSQ